MIIGASLLLPLGFLIFIGSLGLDRLRSSLVRAWGLAVIAIGLLLLALSTLQVGPDDPEHGSRLDKPMLAAFFALAALAWAMLQTIRWTRAKRATRHGGHTAV